MIIPFPFSVAGLEVGMGPRELFFHPTSFLPWRLSNMKIMVGAMMATL